jgi:hypothetical protein
MVEAQPPVSGSIILILAGIVILPDIGGAGLDGEVGALGLVDLVTGARRDGGAQGQVGKLIMFEAQPAVAVRVIPDSLFIVSNPWPGVITPLALSTR